MEAVFETGVWGKLFGKVNVELERSSQFVHQRCAYIDLKRYLQNIKSIKPKILQYSIPLSIYKKTKTKNKTKKGAQILYTFWDAKSKFWEEYRISLKF